MKLLLCPHCQDVRKLEVLPDTSDGKFTRWTKCECGKSWGRYSDEVNAVYGGDAVMLGIANSSLRMAIKLNAQSGGVYPNGVSGPVLGRPVEAFIIPESAPSVKRDRA